VLAVAGIAAYVSYWHAYAVVRAHGETGITAWLEPATIGSLVYASSMVVLYAARHRVPVPSLARWRGERSVGQVAKDFDLTETAVREWVRQAERDAGARQDGGLTSAERRELAELRREDRRLREDVEVLKRATAFFALMP
jgi:transposase